MTIKLRQDGAKLKLNRAAEHIAELNKLLREQHPFSYVIETNTKTGQRATYAKADKAVSGRFSTICGDAAHNLRSALDSAYWEIVSPFAKTEREERQVQFPFSETAARLNEAVSNRLAKRVSARFFKALVELRPYHEAGGNELLCLVDAIDAPDKHRFPTPVADYSALDAAIIRHQVPDYPLIGSLHASGAHRHVVWTARDLRGIHLGQQVPPTTNLFEKKLDVPISLVFPVGANSNLKPVIPTLNAMMNVVRETIAIIYTAAN